jgi:hypothetical protein
MSGGTTPFTFDCQGLVTNEKLLFIQVIAQVKDFTNLKVRKVSRSGRSKTLLLQGANKAKKKLKK